VTAADVVIVVVLWSAAMVLTWRLVRGLRDDVADAWIRHETRLRRLEIAELDRSEREEGRRR
jgi:hypothetical protein